MVQRLRAFTLLEMLTAIAALVVVLGLMVQLARHVRGRSADALTRELLLRLEAAMAEYHRDSGYPPVPPLVTASGPADEPTLQRRALDNNRSLVALLGKRELAARLKGVRGWSGEAGVVCDAWGRPVVFMPPGAANTGLAPQERMFFFSAGPDRQFATLEDNLYSYEQVGGEQK